MSSNRQVVYTPVARGTGVGPCHVVADGLEVGLAPPPLAPGGLSVGLDLPRSVAVDVHAYLLPLPSPSGGEGFFGPQNGYPRTRTPRVRTVPSFRCLSPGIPHISNLYPSKPSHFIPLFSSTQETGVL